MYCSFHSKNDPSGWIRLDKEVKKVSNLSVRWMMTARAVSVLLMQFRFFVAQVLLVRTSGLFDFLIIFCSSTYQFCQKSTSENRAQGNRKTLKWLKMTTKSNFRTLNMKNHEVYLIYRTNFVK